MNNEEIIDYILFERLAPTIDSFNCFNFEDGDVSVIRKLRELYTVWNDETKEILLYYSDFLEDNPNCFFYKCDKLLCEETGKCMLYNRINVNDFYDMLSQMKVHMMNDKDNPFFKLKKIAKKKQDIEQDFK